MLVLVLGACAPKSAPAPSPVRSQAPAPAAAAKPSPVPTAPQSEWDKVLAAAKKEGMLTLYATAANQLLAASRDAMKLYGIKVETIGGGGGDLQVRIDTEQRLARDSGIEYGDLHLAGAAG